MKSKFQCLKATWKLNVAVAFSLLVLIITISISAGLAFELAVVISLPCLSLTGLLCDILTRFAERKLYQPSPYFKVCAQKERDKYGPFRAKRRQQADESP
ncbi:hypothetical protein [Pseudoalteromonas umbrosa]|uniref:hypothetical protein n=1 Tax=Pseudoalteromonas umbrosa TaxID=3048489 RepID=UPI0024C34BCB|nr:hypothetical protein [Pseudoalteromonas sp. B95]MDK1287604.1 hypothetical protein [Pseudoalteromonas sp. B95]